VKPCSDTALWDGPKNRGGLNRQSMVKRFFHSLFPNYTIQYTRDTHKVRTLISMNTRTQTLPLGASSKTVPVNPQDWRSHRRRLAVGIKSSDFTLPGVSMQSQCINTVAPKSNDEKLSHPEISHFKMWIERIIKWQFSHNFKNFPTFIFLYRKYSIGKILWLIFQIKTKLRVLHSYRCILVLLECKRFQKCD
jgi:hypothetical protein